MSMQSWTELGYGIPLNCGDNIEAIKKFICENTRSDSENPRLRLTDEVKTAIMACNDTEAIYDAAYNWASSIVADIINDKEGTTLFRGYGSCGDTDQEEMIGAEPLYPWMMNEKDMTLTEERVDEILVKYAGILGIDEEPYSFNAAYYG